MRAKWLNNVFYFVENTFKTHFKKNAIRLQRVQNTQNIHHLDPVMARLEFLS